MIYFFKVILILLLFNCFFNSNAVSQNSKLDQINPAFEKLILRICSLNLYRLGEKRNKTKYRKEHLSQIRDLSKRIIKGNCDVVGLQEVIGDDLDESREIISELVKEVETQGGNKNFDIVLAKSNDKWNRNAFIYDKSRFNLDYQESAYRQSLPSLDPRSRSWTHVRGPLIIVLSTRLSPNRSILLINYHLKSKASGWKDPTGTNYEISRLHAAAGIRELLDSSAKRAHYPLIKVLLGDRNTGPSGAAAEVLSGRLRFKDFKTGAGCRITPEGTGLCPPEKYSIPDMVPVIQKKAAESKRDIGTYKRGRNLEILDEILISSEALSLARGNDGVLQAGVIGEYRKGSDHLMSWVMIDFSRNIAD
ncbi:MAG TPA: hypothetical protein PKA63_08630 [Oligoflexia bacterium]|mgnify:CR=1 FL=1|nr:hypothetical protein [Oligoflexia bacterium]HMP48716.1 hypothetical protein [Oligoflexia bacterium]